jgi:hypothetical protein
VAFNGSGVFNRVYNWTQDAANAIDITASRVDTEDSGFATGLTLCVTRDGQGAMAADFAPSAANTYAVGTAALPWTQVVTTALQSTKTATQAWGPIAAALVDATPDKGSFTPTYTGFSSAPPGNITWVKMGNIAILTLPNSTGNSNANTYSFSNLPASITPSTNNSAGAIIGMQDNGAPLSVTSGFRVQTNGTVRFTPSPTINFTAWTSSGTKGTTDNVILVYSLI